LCHRAILLFLGSFRRIILALGFLGALFAQLEVFGPSLGKGLYADVALAESGKGRQNHHRVCQQMMRLQAVVIQEISEEIANGQNEASLKVGDEDDSFAGLKCRHSLAGR
jgi:hypothetical protein